MALLFGFFFDESPPPHLKSSFVIWNTFRWTRHYNSFTTFQLLSTTKEIIRFFKPQFKTSYNSGYSLLSYQLQKKSYDSLNRSLKNRTTPNVWWNRHYDSSELKSGFQFNHGIKINEVLNLINLWCHDEKTNTKIENW